MPQRNKYFDFLRGIAIIGVVGIHTYSIPDDFSNPLVYVAGREMLNFAVPLFLVISGLFSMRSFRQKGEYFSYLKKQIPKVYIPTIIWSLPWFVLSLLSGEDFIVSLLYLFTCGFSIFYFIALIIQMYLLLPVYHTVANNRGGVIISGLISIISVFIHTYYMPSELPLVISVGPCVYWLIFFAIGAYFSDKNRNYSLWLPFCLLIVGCITQIFEYMILEEMGKNGIGIKLSSWIYSLGVIMLLISEKVEKKYNENAITSIIHIIGVNSFGIYLVHMLVLIFIRRITHISWIEDWVLAIFFSMALIKLAKLIVPNISNRFLGFKQ